tara:strand:+ start:190 stop:1359 length:1170 start_codon:yes stop_codon:yes gene_type:complete
VGFFSDIMKNPLVQMALPVALGAAAPWAMAQTGLGSLFGGMNPLMANALKQSALGYGTAALSGSKHPGKSAMYAGLTSLPFSYMKANTAAKAFNKANPNTNYTPEMFNTVVDTPAQAARMVGPGKDYPFLSGTKTIDAIPAKYKAQDAAAVKKFLEFQNNYKPKTAMDFLQSPDKLQESALMRPEMRGNINKALPINSPDPRTWGSTGAADNIIPSSTQEIAPVDFFSKQSTGKKNILGAETADKGEWVPDWLPTAVSQSAGLYGGRMTPEEEWEANKKKRNEELAFLYGIDVDQVKGEMQNPYYRGEGYFNSGGIASINYESGGPVNGPGGPKEDLIDAKLSDGEFVMTAKAVENYGGGNREAGAKRMYEMMNQLDPESETVTESIGV